MELCPLITIKCQLILHSQRFNKEEMLSRIFSKFTSMEINIENANLILKFRILLILLPPRAIMLKRITFCVM